MVTLNAFDLIIIGLVALSAVIGVFRGFVKEVLSLAAWIGASWVAWVFAVPAGRLFDTVLDKPALRVLAAGMALFLATLVAATLIGHLIQRTITRTGLAGPDRMLGLLFGALRGVAVVVALVLVLRLLSFQEAQWWQHSTLLPYFDRLGAALVQVLRPEVADALGYR
jgi:membrane protein required for colicin V production